MMTWRAPLPHLCGALLCAMGACAIEIDHSSTEFACVEQELCPPGHECVAGVCRAEGQGVPDAASPSDAIQLDDAAADATPQFIVSVAIGASEDDAEELVGTGAVRIGSTDLELGTDSGEAQLVGLRFASVEVPRDALILSATLQFTVDEVSAAPTIVGIDAQDDNNPAAFDITANNISLRPLLGAPVAWSIPPWLTEGQAESSQQSEELVSLVEALIAKPGWQPGNAMVFVIRGAGTSIAEAFDGDATSSPVLRIVYQ